ncbi:hypothetical protein DPMN_131973 [Dreissena polymorpha]|uniref:Alcohol dehydrogenase-like C-terminal domain-containing protein n=1 Tax=Dreissena polymorpha TaxID=45954 RepID=A0A9D4J8G2_DREPO|nr:hypothetical protein DPMN_131973 [Dreissena polymorpha]
MAKEMGADCVVKVTSKDAKEVAAQVIEALGEKPDFTIECSGAPPSTRHICMGIVFGSFGSCYSSLALGKWALMHVVNVSSQICLSAQYNEALKFPFDLIFLLNEVSS